MTLFRDSIDGLGAPAADNFSEPSGMAAALATTAPGAAPPSTHAATQKLREMSDAQLIGLTRAGEKRAFDILAARHQQMVVAILLRMMDLPDAQDVAQEALLKAYKALHSFRGDSQFSTWLFRIATNTALNHLKTRRRQPSMVHLDAMENDVGWTGAAMSDHDTPEAQVIAEELEGIILQRLEWLTPELRASLIAYELDGKSYQEIAEQMHCPVGTVRSRISRGRSVIDRDLQLQGFTPMRRRCRG